MGPQVLLLTALLAQPYTAVGQEPPARIAWIATRAVEGDSGATVAAGWRARLARDSADRAAAFGLATLARLSYDYPAAAHGYTRLLAGHDGYAAHAILGQALAFRSRAMLSHADLWFARADSAARGVGDSAATAEALIGLALVRVRTVGVEAADSLLHESADLVRNGEPRLQALYRCARSVRLAYVGADDAAPESAAGAGLALRAGEPRIRAQCLSALAGDLARRGLTDSAIGIYGDIETEQRRVHDRAGLAATLQWRAFLQSSSGLYGEARRNFDQAIAEGEASGNLSSVAWSLLNLGGISLELGDLASGQAQLSRATELLAAQGDQWGLASAVHWAGGLAAAAGDLEKARAAYRNALDLYTRVVPNPQMIVTVHSSLARLSLAERDWSQAKAELDSARAAARRLRVPGWDAGLWSIYGALALKRGDLPGAEAAFRQAIAGHGRTQHLYRYRDRTRLAEIFARRGDAARAEKEFAAAAEELDGWRAGLDDRQLRTYVFQTEEDRLDPDLGVATILDALIAHGRADAAFRLGEQRRARELLDRLVRAAALRTGTVGKVGGDSWRVPPPAGITAEQVARGIPDDSTALLEYGTGRGGEPTSVFVVSRAGLRAYRLPPIDSLAPAIRRLIGLLETGADAPALRLKLGNTILGPPLRQLPASVRRLIIVPDDALHRVPFDALETGDGRPVVERFAVSVAPSASVALALWRRPRRTGGALLLALADAVFPEDTLVGGLSNEYAAAFREHGGLPRLVESAAEARASARSFSASTVLTRGDASEAFLKRTPLQSYRVIHFATHALVDEATITRTALALAPGDGEDGFLGPGDLAALELDADLVVLSACRTAGGVVVRGEGVQGLTAPLLEAGARAVIATGWRIGDRAARRFVAGFYLALGTGLAVGDALQAAKLASLRDGRPVNEWAAFTLVGDPLARVLDR